MTRKTMTRKGGAQPGNLNAAHNGTRVHRLVIGELPKDMARVTRYARQYRRDLETAVADTHGGDVDLTKAHFIDAACTHEQHAQVCRWLLRQRIDTMTTADIRECSKQIAASKDARNRAVQALDLDRPPPDPWHLLCEAPTADDSEHEGNGSDATDGNSGNGEGNQ